MSMSYRLGLAAIAAIMSLSAPSTGLANQAGPSAVKAQESKPPRAAAHKKIDTAICNPNSPKVDYNKCYEDVKGK